MPAGFYYKTFIHPRAFWKHLFEPVIRQAAGLGKAPKDRDADRYEHVYAFADMLVIGGGIAGLQAALTAAQAGKRVMLLEQTAHWGGRAPVDGVEIDGKPASALDRPNHRHAGRYGKRHPPPAHLGAGVYDHGYVLANERTADHTPGDGRPKQRLWRIRAAQIITATGAIERPLSFAGNDIPGVMLAASVRDYITNFAVSPGDRTVIATNNDDAYLTALAIKAAGLSVPVIVDARPEANGDLPKQRPRRWHPRPDRPRHSLRQRRQTRHRRHPLPASGRRRGHRNHPTATPSPCPAAGRPWCTSGPIAAAS